MFGSFMGALMQDWAQPDCFASVGTVTALLAGSLAINAVLGILLCVFTGYLFTTRARTMFRRIYIGRCLVLTQTSPNRLLFALAYTMDIISFVLLVVELVMLP